MAALPTVTPGSGVPTGTKPGFYQGTFQGVAASVVAPMGLVFVNGSVDAHTFTEAPGDGANGLDVDVTRLPADPLGANADAVVAAGAAGSISGKLRQISTDLDAMRASLALLDNAIAGNELQVDIVSGGLTITRPSTVTRSTPATGAASAPLIAANANRLGLEVVNKSVATLHLVRGAVAATEANATVQIDPKSYWSDPTGYTGEIRCILDAGAGASTAAVAEFTA